MIFYHLTKNRHRESIQTKGLKPGYRRGLTVRKQKQTKVFITNDIEKILHWQAGLEWAEKHEAIVVIVDIDSEIVEPVRYYSGGTYTISDFEFTTGPIDSNKIVNIESLKDFQALYDSSI